MKDTILLNRPRGFRASAIVVKDKQILLMRQIFHGDEFYNLPGGAWEQGEYLEQTCVREVKEEFDLDVAVNKLAYILDSSPRMNFIFYCHYLAGEIKLGGPEEARMTQQDQYHVEWVDINKLADLNIQPQVTKQALLKFLTDPSIPTFYTSTVKQNNNRILIISSRHNPTPPSQYGGIERIAALACQHYQQAGYQVDIVSTSDSKLHTFAHDQISHIDFKPYRFIISYDYTPTHVKLLDKQDAAVFIILQNNYSPKLKYLSRLRYSIPKVLSKAQQTQFYRALGIKFDIIPNGINLDFYKINTTNRKKDIVSIGLIGQHKSPLSCLQYAKKYNLAIDFYGPVSFRPEEKDYQQKFNQALKAYSKAKLHPAIDDQTKLKLLNQYKYFIFLPGKDKPTWTEPFGIAPLEAMACGCTVITDPSLGGHAMFCHPQNTISPQHKPKQLDPLMVRQSIKDYDFNLIFKKYYPK